MGEGTNIRRISTAGLATNSRNRCRMRDGLAGRRLSHPALSLSGMSLGLHTSSESQLYNTRAGRDEGRGTMEEGKGHVAVPVSSPPSRLLRAVPTAIIKLLPTTLLCSIASSPVPLPSVIHNITQLFAQPLCFSWTFIEQKYSLHISHLHLQYYKHAFQGSGGCRRGWLSSR